MGKNGRELLFYVYRFFFFNDKSGGRKLDIQNSYPDWEKCWYISEIYYESHRIILFRPFAPKEVHFLNIFTYQWYAMRCFIASILQDKFESASLFVSGGQCVLILRPGLKSSADFFYFLEVSVS